MKITSNQDYNTKQKPSFSAITANSAAKKYIKENFSIRAIRKLDRLIEEQKKNFFNINLSTDTYVPWSDRKSMLDFYTKPSCSVEYLKIHAGDKTFNNLNLFSTSIGQIKKAIKYLTKYEKTQALEQESAKVIDKL